MVSKGKSKPKPSALLYFFHKNKEGFADLKKYITLLHSDLETEMDFMGEMEEKWINHEELDWTNKYDILHSLSTTQAILAILTTYHVALIQLCEKLAKNQKIEIQIPKQFQKEVNEFMRERESMKKRMREYVG